MSIYLTNKLRKFKIYRVDLLLKMPKVKPGFQLLLKFRVNDDSDETAHDYDAFDSAKDMYQAL